jgi:IS30 family transposase
MTMISQRPAVAADLNDRPRKTLGWNTPAALLAAALSNDSHS